MSRPWPLAFVSVLLLTSCANSNRKLQSITINSVENGQQVELVATGTFSSSPTTVNPLPVSWSLAPPPSQYTLTTEPFQLQCNSDAAVAGPIVAMAPSNPQAPKSGSVSNTNMIIASSAVVCP